jgi:3D (Asp-Asp-Asp) domain-containing protein
MTQNLKTRIVAIAILLSVAGYIMPFAVTKAGSDPSNQAALPGAPTVLSMRITAYASVVAETDNTPFITANGTYVHDGVVATNLLPFGTEIMIPSLFGNKVFTVDDRMAARFKNSVDIWMPSVGKALYFGVHYAQVVVIPPGPTLAMNSAQKS